MDKHVFRNTSVALPTVKQEFPCEDCCVQSI